MNDEWYQLHINKERHHLLSRCPEDVNLLDVLEMVVDCVCAGMARSGDVYPIEINDDILNKALSNTIELIKNMTEEFEKEHRHELSTNIFINKTIKKIKEIMIR